MEDAGALNKEPSGLFKSRYRVSSLGTGLYLHGSFPTDAAGAVFFGPDTYRFVSALEMVLPRLQSVRRAVDIGCGSGAGAIAMATQFPHAEILMSDINPEALMCARVSAALAGHNGIQAVQSDLLDEMEGEFDLIISNPPYLMDSLRRDYRHGGGSYGEELSLRIVKCAADRLAPGGALILYTGSAIVNGDDPFRNAAADILRQNRLSFDYREVDPDVFGEELENEPYVQADRLAAVLLIAKKEKPLASAS